MNRERVLSIGIRFLAMFFLFGAVMSGLAGLLLLVPGTPLDSVWEINPRAHSDLASLGGLAIALMGAVSVTCLGASIGLWARREWGRWLAIVLLSMNLVGDAAALVLRNDLRTLIGLPVGGALLAFLLSSRVRRHFTRGALAT